MVEYKTNVKIQNNRIIIIVHSEFKNFSFGLNEKFWKDNESKDKFVRFLKAEHYFKMKQPQACLNVIRINVLKVYPDEQNYVLLFLA